MKLTFKKWFFIFLILYPFLQVHANPSEDEQWLSVMLYCSVVFEENKSRVYEKDLQDIKRIISMGLEEIKRKYTKTDADKMWSRSLMKSWEVKIKEDPVASCRRTIASVVDLKSITGSVLFSK